MAKELSDLFNVNRLRTLWKQTSTIAGSPVGAESHQEPAATKEPAADRPSTPPSDPAEYLRRQAERSHIPEPSPDEILRALGRAINESLQHESLSLLNIWQPLQSEVAMLSSPRTNHLNTSTVVAKSSPDQLYRLIDQLDDAVTALLANRSR